MKLEQLCEERTKLIQENRALLDKAEKEKRSALTAEERSEYDKRDAQIDELDESIKLLNIQEKREQAQEQRSGAPAGRPDPSQGGKIPDETRTDDKPPQVSELVRQYFGEQAGNGLMAKAEYRSAFSGFIRNGRLALPDTQEFRALQADISTSGAFLVAPQQFVAELLKFVDDAVAIRALARKFTVTQAESLGVPSLDTDVSDADWTSELAIGGEDTALAIGKRELRPHPLGKLVKVSNKLLRMAALSPETLVRDRLGYKFAVSEEKAFLTGSGAQQPLGIFTASADGISTGRDVSTGNTTTAIGADNLIEVQHTLKPQYWATARWIFHRDAIKQIRKLKDGQGQYLWQPGLRGGVPNEILGMPYIASEFAPKTFTTGLYVGILGDFSFYWIADALAMQVQRLVELYAATAQTGFIGRMETDGMPVLEEAFVRVTLA